MYNKESIISECCNLECKPVPLATRGMLNCVCEKTIHYNKNTPLSVDPYTRTKMMTKKTMTKVGIGEMRRSQLGHTAGTLAENWRTGTYVWASSPWGAYSFTTQPNINVINVVESNPIMNAILLAIFLVICTIAAMCFCKHYEIVRRDEQDYSDMPDLVPNIVKDEGNTTVRRAPMFSPKMDIDSRACSHIMEPLYPEDLSDFPSEAELKCLFSRAVRLEDQTVRSLMSVRNASKRNSSAWKRVECYITSK